MDLPVPNMAFDPLSAALNVGSSLLNYFGGKEAAASNREHQDYINELNYSRQQQANATAIQTRVADARAAGVHPLYALGAPTMSYAPAQVGASAPNQMAPLAQGMRDLGQNLSGKSTPGGQNVPNAYQTETMVLDLENRKLQNELLRNKVVSSRTPAAPPVGDFVVPENPKVEQNPPLMFGGKRWTTSSGTSPMKAWEDRYGDEGPVASALPLLILDKDFQQNYPIASWPGHVSRWGVNMIKDELMGEYGRAQQYMGKYWPQMLPRGGG